MNITFAAIPMKNESPISLIYRCVNKNGYKSIAQFLLDCPELSGRPLAHTFQSSQWKSSLFFKILSKSDLLSAHDQRQVEECFYLHGKRPEGVFTQIGSIKFPDATLRSRLALCPACLREGYFPNTHSLIFSSICSIHGERLLVACPACNRSFDWLRLENFHCPCGFNIQNSEPNLCDSRNSELFSEAFETNNVSFFELLIASYTAYSSAHFNPDNDDTLQSCINISSDNKSVFFREILKLQKKFPALHRRAILAPFLFSRNPKLRNYARDCYLHTQQSKPLSHPADCTCGSLRYTAKQARYIFTTQSQLTQLISEKLCRFEYYGSGKNSQEELYYCPELCKTIYELDNIRWDHEEKQLDSQLDMNVLSYQKAAEILHVKPEIVRRLIKDNLIRGENFPHPTGLCTTIPAIHEFKKSYILGQEISKSLGIKGRKLEKLLKNFTPVKTTTYHVHKLLVYRRTSLPGDIIEKTDSPLIKKIDLPKKNFETERSVTSSELCSLLDIDSKDIFHLIGQGILDARTQEYNKRSSKLTSPSALKRATKWRNDHISLQEASKRIGCSVTMLRTRFINTNFIPSIKLYRTYIHKDDFEVIANHYHSYTSLASHAKLSGLHPGTLLKLIDSNKLRSVPRDHPDHIPGMVIFSINDGKNAVREYKEAKGKVFIF